MKYREGIDYRPITEGQITKIARSFDGVDLEGLRLALDDAAKQFIHAHYEQQAFTRHGELAKRLANIEVLAKRLLLELNVDDAFELESILNVGLGSGRENKLPPLIEQITLLKQVAGNAAFVQGEQKKESHNRSDGDPAFAELLGNLREIYITRFEPDWGSEYKNKDDAFLNGLAPKFTERTIDGGGVEGKFSIFVELAISSMKENLSSVVMTSDPSIEKSLQKTPKAIRSHFGRLKPDQK